MRDRRHEKENGSDMKMNIVRSLNKRGCKVTIVPWNTPAEAIVALEPDGIFISNGPGDRWYCTLNTLSLSHFTPSMVLSSRLI